MHRGRVVDAKGDAILAEFASVVDAVSSAVEIQRKLAEKNAELPNERRMDFRIGINLGDVVVKDDVIYGDGVNIAARLESLAEPGGICISRPVYDQVESKLNLECEYLGEQQVAGPRLSEGACRDVRRRAHLPARGRTGVAGRADRCVLLPGRLERADHSAAASGTQTRRRTKKITTPLPRSNMGSRLVTPLAVTRPRIRKGATASQSRPLNRTGFPHAWHVTRLARHIENFRRWLSACWSQ